MNALGAAGNVVADVVEKALTAIHFKELDKFRVPGAISYTYQLVDFAVQDLAFVCDKKEDDWIIADEQVEVPEPPPTVDTVPPTETP